MLRASALLALVALVALAPSGVAQGDGLQTEGCRAPVLTMQQWPERFSPGSTVNLQFSVENRNIAPVETTRATISTTTPAGWSATPAQREMTLGPNDVQFDVLAVAAPHRGTGEAGGNITLLVTFVCAGGDIQTSASETLTFPVQVSGFQAPWPLVLAGFLVLAAGVGILGIRRLRRGVAIACKTPERLVAPGKSAKFEVLVENRRGKPQRLTLLALGVPPGWQMHLALEDVELEPGEDKNLWAILKAPPMAEPGEEATVTLRLVGRGASREGASTVVRARVTGA